MTAALLKVTRLPHGEGLPLPEKKSEHAAGADLAAAVFEDIDIAPGQRVLVGTGFVVAIPDGHEGQVRPRSGLALQHGLTVLNAPGTIDADYRGELKVLLINLGETTVTITRGMRIAQLVVAPVSNTRIEEVVETNDLGETARGVAGFGSTGAH